MNKEVHGSIKYTPCRHLGALPGILRIRRIARSRTLNPASSAWRFRQLPL